MSSLIAEVDERAILSGRALATIATAFLLVGIVVSAYGPLLGYLAHRFGVSLPIAGGVLSAHFAGALVGVICLMPAMEWFPNRHIVVTALGVLGLGCALVALAPTWPTLLGAVFVVGVGFGALEMGLNQLVAHGEGTRRAATLNLLNGSFAIGAVLGPILVAVLAQGHFAALYLGGAVLAIALIPGGLQIPGRLPVPPRPGGGRPRVLVVIFVVAFALYVGTEAGVGGWVTSHLKSVGMGSASAALVTSGFWLALGLGRLIVGLVSSRVPESAIVTVGAALGALALIAAISGLAAPFAYIVTGLAFAPIFPTGIAWLAKLLPGDARATSWLFPGSMLGGAVIPAAISFVISRIGLGAAPAVLSAMAFATLLAFALAAMSSLRQPRLFGAQIP
jgi:fucose permease